jgi:hypothetical protein
MSVAVVDLLLWVPSALFALGAFILARLGVLRLVDLGRALRLRFRGQTAPVIARLQALRDAGTQTQDQKRRLPVTIWVGLGAGLALGLFWLHPLVTPWFIILGLGVAWMLISTRRSMTREDLRGLEVFISSLRSVLSVGESVFLSLEVVAEDLDEGPVQAAVAEAIRRYRADMDTRGALAALNEVGWTRLDRLALILGEAQWADDQTLQAVLLDQEERVQRARYLQDRADAVLTMTRLTLRVLQAFNVAAIVVVTLIPDWHAFYLAHPLGLVAATAASLAGSWYFSAEIKRMESIV